MVNRGARLDLVALYPDDNLLALDFALQDFYLSHRLLQLVARALAGPLFHPVLFDLLFARSKKGDV